ncbi:DUF6531 domain-containing protein [uncultured Friedmanniella sp.]|uniref:DUF6531 domain-containing protein n=1 Tax=uncultured Friedmanniella sp. TaxID=335381 RepID=UPI0035CC2DCE
MADLGVIEADVVFDVGVADALIAKFEAAAVAVEGQAGSRLSWQITAQIDFAGHFSKVFAANAAVAAGDAVELCARLREVTTGARLLKEEARKEQQRRETARAWQSEHDARSNWDKVGDFFSGGDDPPVGPPAAEPTIPVSAPVNRSRETPAPGSGGSSGGGTSSARPADLRTFATGSTGANDELRPQPVVLRAALTSFDQSCQWGRLDAWGVAAGFERWLAANDEDVRWASTLATAFAAAGGDHAVSTVSNNALSAALKAAHVDASREDLVIEAPQAHGNPPTTGYANDPVNTATGNFVENETDLSFPGAASGLALTRCYNSADLSGGAFGPGWSSWSEAGLVFDSGQGVARFRLPDGRVIVFSRLGTGWDRAVGEALWLTGDENALQVTDNAGGWWRFDLDGTLLAAGTGPESDGNAVRLHRDPAGRLAGLAHGRGRYVDLDWGTVAGAERLVAAAASDGRSVSYRYDEAGRLIAATGPAGTRSYGWDPAGLVVSVTDADGVVEVENVYDGQRRVVSQRSPFGRVTRFAYLPGRVTVVSDEDGNRSNTWIADERGRLVGVVDAEEQRQSTSYDRYGNPVLLTERDGAATVHQYDGRGRRVRTVTPSGADVTYGYDELDRVTTVVAEQGAVTEYTYEGEQRNPSRIVDPEGGLTRLVWSDGLLTKIVDPTDVVVRFSHDQHGDLIGTTNAEGQTARLERDAWGRVTAAVTPSGHRTLFTWDPTSGSLVQRQDPDGAVWRYEHTVAGRLTATVDPLGARTSVEYGVYGEEARTVDPLGRAVTRQLDDLGRVASVELPDGSSWRFVHDSLSRLVATTDPTGSIWSRAYDPAGRLVATVDPTGVRVGVGFDQAGSQVEVADGAVSSTTGFDPLGRLTSVGQVDGTAAVYTYDRCGRPVEALNADGGLTRIVRDPAGRPISVTSPSGATTRYGYDRCGRLVTVTDPLGGTVTVGYDVDGQAVTQTLATGEVARSRFDACGRLVEHTAPGVGMSGWVYDLAGRVVEWVNPQTGRSTYRYDAAGQLVSATDGNGGVTTYRSDVLGRTVEVVNPLGGVTRREFDAMNRCIAETDPLGRTTTAGYDAAGRLAWQESPDASDHVDL